MGKKSEASLVALVVKNLPANARDIEMWVQSLGWKDPLEEEMAAHSSILAWEIPCAEEPGPGRVHGRSWPDRERERECVYTCVCVYVCVPPWPACAVFYSCVFLFKNVCRAPSPPQELSQALEAQQRPSRPGPVPVARSCAPLSFSGGSAS